MLSKTSIKQLIRTGVIAIMLSMPMLVPFVSNASESHVIVPLNGIETDKTSDDCLLGFIFRINKNWQLSELKKDDFEFSGIAPEKLEFYADNTKEEISDFGGGMFFAKQVYENRAIFAFKTHCANTVKPLNVDLSYQICSDTMCIPKAKQFVFDSQKFSHQKHFFVANYIRGKEFRKLIAKVWKWTYIPILSVLGGLLLNLMPCVLPVLSLKVMSLTKFKKKTRNKIKRQLFWSSIGIVLFMESIAFVVYIAQKIGIALNWGFYFQNKYFAMTMSGVMLFLILYSFGFLEIRTSISSRLLTRINNIVDKYESGKYGINSLIAGFFSASLATPCVAPLLAPAITFSMGSGSVAVFVIFGLIGVGLASPYLTLYFFPKMVQLIPSKGWVSLLIKNITSSFLVLTMLWLIWIVSKQTSIFFGLIMVGVYTSLVFIFYIFSEEKYKFSFKKSSVFICIMISFFVAVFGFGFYKSKQNNSNGHTWVDFDPAKIEEYLINGQMVFIDITADWCFNCKVNKIVAIDRKDTVQFFKDNNIIGMRGNITSKNPVVLDFMSNNNINGIPYNAIYTINHKEGVAMPVILTSSILKTEIQKAMLN